MRAHQADGLLRVVDLVCAGVVSIATQAAAQDDGIDTVIVEKGNKVRAFRTDVQEVVPASGHQNYSSTGVQPVIDGVHFDGWVVYVDDVVDSARHGLVHVVLLSLTNLLHVEKGRA